METPHETITGGRMVTRELANWVAGIDFEDLPAEVVELESPEGDAAEGVPRRWERGALAGLCFFSGFVVLALEVGSKSPPAVVQRFEGEMVCSQVASPAVAPVPPPS